MSKKNPTTVTARYVVGPIDEQVVLMLGDILAGSGTSDLLRTVWTVAEARALAKALNAAANAVEGTDEP